MGKNNKGTVLEKTRKHPGRAKVMKKTTIPQLKKIKKDHAGASKDYKAGNTVKLVARAERREYNKLVAQDISAFLNREVATRLSDSSLENVQDLNCLVNPQLLFQYIYALWMKPIANTDNLSHLQLAQSAAVTTFRDFENLFQLYAGISLPGPLVKLRRLFEPKRSGKFSFVADFNGVNACAADVVANGIKATNVGLDLTYPTGTYAGTQFGNIATFTPVVSLPLLSAFVSEFQASYHPRDIERVTSKSWDCSAFAFDPAGAVPAGSVNATGNSMASHAGFSLGSTTSLYIRQAGSWGLEVKPKNIAIAACRFCTPSPAYIANLVTANAVRSSRIGLATGVAGTLPSVVAFNSGPNRLKGPVALKPISLVSACGAIMQKMETICSNAQSTPAQGQSTLGTAWLSAWNATGSDVRMLIFAWAKYQFKTYSGAYFGTYLVSGGTAFVPMWPERHQGFEMLGMSTIPESVNMALKCLAPYMDSDGTFIPWSPNVNANLISIGLVYTGPNTSSYGVIPNLDSESGITNNGLRITNIYKPLEPQIAPYTKSDDMDRDRDTLLDITLVLGKNSGNAVSIRSKRPLDVHLYDYALRNIRFLTYDYCTDDAGFNNTSSVSQEYSQRYRRDLGNLDSPTDIQTVNRYNGLVTNGFASNLTAATGDDNAGSAVAQGGFAAPALEDRVPRNDLTREPPQDNASLVSKFFAAHLPRKGNYCGPGWTAGVDTFQKETYVTPQGEYVVAPVDDEDAVCKRHDEAYRASKGDRELINAADWQMVKELEAIRLTKGLTRYAHASQEAIRLKAQIMF